MSQHDQVEHDRDSRLSPTADAHMDYSAADRTCEGDQSDGSFRIFDCYSSPSTLDIESGSFDSSDPLNLYTPCDETYNAWERALRVLGKMIALSWMECEERELAKRHSLVPELVRATLEILAYTTGCEIYATGVYIENKQGWNPTLCTSSSCPGSVIYPHPDRDARPTFPLRISATYPQNQRLLHDFFSYQMQWQGGGPPVPYDLIKAEYLADEEKIVTRAHLPQQLSYLKDPMLMTEREVSSMIEHIIAGQEERMPAANIFRFEEFRPGAYAHESPTGCGGDTSLFYRPDTRAFASRIEAQRRSAIHPRTDGLGMISTEAPYLSLPAEAITAYRKILPTTDPWWILPAALNDHDWCHPVYASSEHWDSRARQMPHLREDEPFLASAGDHLVSDQSWLPLVFFDWRDLNHAAWCLTTIIQWCQPRHWLHSESQTVFGGPLGIKWPIIILGHLRHQVNRFVHLNDRWLSHYKPLSGDLSADIKLVFERTDIEQIDATIDDLFAALKESTLRLQSTLEARKKMNPEWAVMQSSMDAHVGFPTSHTDFHTITPLPLDDPWDESWEEKIAGLATAGEMSDGSLPGNIPIGASGASEPGRNVRQTSPSRLRPIRRVTTGGNVSIAQESENRGRSQDEA
ncbi:hypothetical protein RSAG8_07188, partial [Rhizoctonia solani AG-8 WAC10335]